MVDILYNHIYNNSVKQKTGSLKEEYINQVRSFVIGIKKESESFKSLVLSLHAKFAAHYVGVTYAGFVDLVVGSLTPPDSFRKMRTDERDEILSHVLCDLMSNLAVYITEATRVDTIVSKSTRKQQMARSIQDHGILLLRAKRDELYNKFLGKIGQAKAAIPTDTLDKMKIIIYKLAEEKTQMKSEIEKMTNLIGRYEERDKKFRRLFTMYQNAMEGGVRYARTIDRVPPPMIGERRQPPRSHKKLPGGFDRHAIVDDNHVNEADDPEPQDDEPQTQDGEPQDDDAGEETKETDEGDEIEGSTQPMKTPSLGLETMSAAGSLRDGRGGGNKSSRGGDKSSARRDEASAVTAKPVAVPASASITSAIVEEEGRGTREVDDVDDATAFLRS